MPRSAKNQMSRVTAEQVEIRIRDRDGENSVHIRVSEVPGYFVDAHRLRHMWDRDDPLTDAVIDFLRSMARGDYIACRLPQCAVVMALSLLQEIAPDDALRRIRAALGVPGTVLDMDFTQDGAPVYCAKLAEMGDASWQ